MSLELARRLAVARGDEPADVVVRGGRVLSVFTREWLDVDVAIADGWIAGLGEYDGVEVVDASGRYVVPGFIDAHMHLESSKLLPDEFARLVLPLGTTAVVADPHEIANVLGTDGVHWLLDASAGIPLDVYFMASSSVPASEYESPRRALTEGDLEALLRRRRVLGVAEMMNFPGVVVRRRAELAKLALATHVDGHAPGVSGRALQAYAAAGIRSDHEASTLDEGRERLRAGMWLLMREASAARNLRTLLPLVAEYGPHRIAFCTDDREPEHIAEDGHINAMVRDAVEFGVSPEDALVMASHNPADYHGLEHLGAIAPGRQADLVLLGDLERFVPELVLKRGKPVEEVPRATVPDWVRHTVRIGALGPEMFRIAWSGGVGARDRPRARADHHGVAGRRAEAPRRRGRRRSRARPREDRGDRAAPRDRAQRPRVRPRFRPPSRRDRLDALARRAQPRGRRDGRHVDGVRRARGSRTSAAGSSSSTAASCSRSCRYPWRGSFRTLRSRRSSRRARRSSPPRASSAARSRRRSSCSRSSRCR